MDFVLAIYRSLLAPAHTYHHSKDALCRAGDIDTCVDQHIDN